MSTKKVGRKHLVKGSPEAKAYMARLRKMQKAGPRRARRAAAGISRNPGHSNPSGWSVVKGRKVVYSGSRGIAASYARRAHGTLRAPAGVLQNPLLQVFNNPSTLPYVETPASPRVPLGHPRRAMQAWPRMTHAQRLDALFIGGFNRHFMISHLANLPWHELPEVVKNALSHDYYNNPAAPPEKKRFIVDATTGRVLAGPFPSSKVAHDNFLKLMELMGREGHYPAIRKMRKLVIADDSGRVLWAPKPQDVWSNPVTADQYVRRLPPHEGEYARAWLDYLQGRSSAPAQHRIGAMAAHNIRKTLGRITGVVASAGSVENPAGGFAAWMQKVNEWIGSITGLTSEDLADQPWNDWYEDGVSARNAANRAIRSEGFSNPLTSEEAVRIHRDGYDHGAVFHDKARVQMTRDWYGGRAMEAHRIAKEYGPKDPAMNPPTRHKGPRLKNPSVSCPFREGQKILVETARKWVHSTGDKELIRQFSEAEKLQAKANKKAKYVVWKTLAIGTPDKIDSVAAMVQYGESPETIYKPPKGSKKGPHLYRHEWGEGSGKKKPVPILAAPGGKAIIMPLGPGQTVGDWMRG